MMVMWRSDSIEDMRAGAQTHVSAVGGMSSEAIVA